MRIETKGGCFSYGKEKTLLKDISFVLDDNRITAVLGSNGSGKTTLLKCMLGIRKWKSGATFWDGKSTEEMSHSELWRKTGYVPQAKAICPYTALEMTVLGRSACRGLLSQPGAEDIEKARQALEFAGITHLADRTCSRLSQGEFQMVLFARALAGEPEVLIMDEPEAGLDIGRRQQILELTDILNRERGIQVIFVTHSPEHAWALADDVLLLYNDSTCGFGKRDTMLTPMQLKRVYGVELEPAVFRGRTYFVPDCGNFRRGE